MSNNQYNVGIIGCGMILKRHIESIKENNNFKLVSLCDIDPAKTTEENFVYAKKYSDYKRMILAGDLNFVVIASPNALHYEHAVFALEHNCDVLIEKPVTLDPSLIPKIQKVASKHNQKAYCVLQVRLNPCVQKIKELLDDNKLGNIRGVSLIQRWQRPKEYFDDWRGDPKIGGGILHECGIHYIDILCYLLGLPSVHSTKSYQTKHKDKEIEDTIYSIVDFGDYGGTIEVSIACEPSNLECSLSIMTDIGSVKIGGKAMDQIREFNFLEDYPDLTLNNITLNLDKHIKPNLYKAYSGSCPNHPNLYRNIEKFDISHSLSSIILIDEIYKTENKKYY